ncbi:hypothetical protein THASP1DRAFT_27902 [Thamnocephalis sphaerospora]|uniref:Phytanoyl-CoA dioxygenase n=1 Tax=Thamnocephalis sphaerospora TaxID=78915 RepID=A0A4P9XY06_9FUNG|nr:hypothetical protein THASP1DRAFT_27902 [Thamnocephalis sphaerospora]|eukprot:RKP10310.1 hypothetical protein THASP1DRAFT_27902 [Thamnocephalis sphaerospora]
MWTLSEEQQRAFHRHGYVVLHSALPLEQLRTLRNDCEQLLDELEELDLLSDAGCVIEPMLNGRMTTLPTETHRQCQYDAAAYSQQRWGERPEGAVLLCHHLPRLVAQLLPSASDVDGSAPRLCLFNEQYIVKPPRTQHQSIFAWHQDGEYMNETCQRVPTVACWIALDDVNEAATYNAWHDARAARYSPQNAHDVQAVSETVHSLALTAGSILIMSARVRHCSTGNGSGRTRRAYMPQYSAGVVAGPDARPLALAVPCDCPVPTSYRGTS